VTNRWAAVVLALCCAGCSIRGMALNAMAEALSGQGSTFAGDEDPELVREAIPFGLKTYESVLAELPEHRGLLLATAGGFTQYAYAFVMADADRVDVDDAAAARELRARAKRLFLRGRDYAFRGLMLDHPGIFETLRKEREGALSEMTADDVPFLYWTGVSWAAALMAEKGDLSLMADLPLAGALVRKSIELDPSYHSGAAHEFMIAKALAVDPDVDPANRLVNVLARRRARWLLGRIPDLFLEVEEEKK
jgi:predicted anti-sigma-YlaC factor YlaD